MISSCERKNKFLIHFTSNAAVRKSQMGVLLCINKVTKSKVAHK